MNTPERTYSQDLDGVYAALQDLASVGDGRPAAIGAHLYRLGVRGGRKTSFSCPVANWLRLLFGADCDPEVEEGTVRVRKFGETDWILPPLPIDALISAIDDGGYTELIEEESRAA